MTVKLLFELRQTHEAALAPQFSHEMASFRKPSVPRSRSSSSFEKSVRNAREPRPFPWRLACDAAMQKTQCGLAPLFVVHAPFYAHVNSQADDSMLSQTAEIFRNSTEADKNMTTIATNPDNSALRSRCANIFSRFGTMFAHRAQMRRATTELFHLTDRELADIGINRYDIPRIAAEHS